MSSNLSLSFELICLMGWLLKNDKDKLKKLIKDAVDLGFAAELDTINSSEYHHVNDEMHTTIEDFMEYLEDILIESVEGSDAHEGAREKLLGTVKRIDGEAFDSKTVWLSMQQAKSQLVKKAKMDPAKAHEHEANALWFDQLLKNWTPSGNESMN